MAFRVINPPEEDEGAAPAAVAPQPVPPATTGRFREIKPPTPMPAPSPPRSIGGEFLAGARRSIPQHIKGVGSTVELLSDSPASGKMMEAAARLESRPGIGESPRLRQLSQTYSGRGAREFLGALLPGGDPDHGEYALRRTAATFGEMAPSMGVAALYPPAAPAVLAGSGYLRASGSGFEKELSKGKDRETAARLGAAYGVVEGAGEYFGGRAIKYGLRGVTPSALRSASPALTDRLRPIANALERNVATRVAKRVPEVALTEAATEYGQEYGEASVEAVGDRSLEPFEGITGRAGEAGALGALMGGAAGSVSSVTGGPNIEAPTYRDLNLSDVETQTFQQDMKLTERDYPMADGQVPPRPVAPATSQQRMADRIGRAFGLNVVFVEGGNSAKWNGFTRSQDDANTIYVSTTANNPAQLVGWHETMHRLERNDPSTFKKIQQAVQKRLKNENAELALAKQRLEEELKSTPGDSARYGEIKNELAAIDRGRVPESQQGEFMADMLATIAGDPSITNREFLRELAGEDKGGTLRKLADAVDGFIDKIEGMGEVNAAYDTSSLVTDLEGLRDEARAILQERGKEQPVPAPTTQRAPEAEQPSAPTESATKEAIPTDAGVIRFQKRLSPKDRDLVREIMRGRSRPSALSEADELNSEFSDEMGFVDGEFVPSDTSVKPVSGEPKPRLIPERFQNFNPDEEVKRLIAKNALEDADDIVPQGVGLGAVIRNTWGSVAFRNEDGETVYGVTLQEDKTRPGKLEVMGFGSLYHLEKGTGRKIKGNPLEGLRALGRFLRQNEVGISDTVVPELRRLLERRQNKPEVKAGVTFQRRITTAQDRAYMKAVERGDMSAAQKIVDATAKRNGFSIKAFHGTTAPEFTSFNLGAGGFKTGADSAVEGVFATSSRENARSYSENIGIDGMFELTLRKDSPKSKARDAALKTEEGLRLQKELDKKNEALKKAHKNALSQIRSDMQDRLARSPEAFSGMDIGRLAEELANTEYYSRLRSDRGFLRAEEQAVDKADAALNGYLYDAVSKTLGGRVMPVFIKMKNPQTFDAKGKTPAEFPLTEKLKEAKRLGHDGVIFKNIVDPDIPATHYVVFDSRQIKSADPVVRDDQGNIVPLSERFNPEKDDIRFQRRYTRPIDTSKAPELFEAAKQDYEQGRVRTVGRPELANIGERPEERAAFDTADELRKQQGIPEVKKDADVERRARQMINEDPEGMEKMVVERAMTGESYRTAEEAKVGQILSLKLIDKAFKENDIGRMAELASNYRDPRSEAARILRTGHDPLLSPAERNKGHILGMIADTGRLGKRGKKRTPKQREADLKRASRNWSKVVKELKKRGFDIKNWTEKDWNDTNKVLGLTREIGALNSRLSDKAYEWWINSILSGPHTQGANIIGNTVNAGLELFFRPAEAAINSVVNREGVTTSDVFSAHRALVKAIGRGFRNARLAWAHEFAQLEMAVEGRFERGFKGELSGPAIGGKKGKFIRAFGTRPLLALDEFAKGIIGEIEAHIIAHQIARNEGAKGRKMDERIDELVNDLGGPAWTGALDRAKYLTFQAELGEVGRAMTRFGKSGPLKYVFPFIRTPINIFKRGLRLTPAGALRLALSENQTRSEVTRTAAEQIFAWGMVMFLSGMLDDEDEKGPRITGTKPWKIADQGERELAYRTVPPMSIRVGDHVFSYSRIEPFATTLASIIDGLEMARDYEKGKPGGELAGEAFKRLLAQTQDKTFLRGAASLMAAMEDERMAARFFGDTALGFVPNIVRQPLRNSDEVLREGRYWGAGRGPDDKGETFTSRYFRRLREGAAPGLDPAPARRDLFGREVLLEGSTIWRVAIPLKYRNMASVPPDLMAFDERLRRFNASNPDKEYWPVSPTKTITHRGERYHLSDEDFSEYVRLAGEAARDRIQWVANMDRPLDERDIEAIRKQFEKAREQARRQMIPRLIGR